MQNQVFVVWLFLFSLCLWSWGSNPGCHKLWESPLKTEPQPQPPEFVCIWLISLNILSMNIKWQTFVLFYAINIPLYKCTFLTHSSTSGHLGWFHILGIMNVMNVNMWVQVSLTCWFPFLWMCIHSSRVAESHGSSVSSFLRTSILFSIVALLIYISYPALSEYSHFSKYSPLIFLSFW